MRNHPRVYLLVSEEVILGVKHLPADVTGVATLLMSPLLVFTKTFVPVCFENKYYSTKRHKLLFLMSFYLTLKHFSGITNHIKVMKV